MGFNDCIISMRFFKLTSSAALRTADRAFSHLGRVKIAPDTSTNATELLVGKGHSVPILMQLWAVLQSIASIALVFLMALGIRNLFRLK